MTNGDVDLASQREDGSMVAAIDPDQAKVSDLGPVTFEDFKGIETPPWWKRVQLHPSWFYVAIMLVLLNFFATVDGVIDLVQRLSTWLSAWL